MARGFIEDGKITLAWKPPRLLLPKNQVKLLLNMLIIASQTIPRGGTPTVDPTGAGETMGFRITAAGLNARIPQHVPDLLAGNSENGTVDAHAVQPFYTGLLARSCGSRSGLRPRVRRSLLRRGNGRPWLRCGAGADDHGRFRMPCDEKCSQ
jgi:histidine phosphotransferase ChpT